MVLAYWILVQRNSCAY